MYHPINVSPEIIGYRVNAQDGTTTHLLALPEDFQFVGFMKTSEDILSCIYVPAGPTGNRPILKVKTRKGAKSFLIDFAAYGPGECPPPQPESEPRPRQIDYAAITHAVSTGSAS
jgi:hypothetical protein